MRRTMLAVLVVVWCLGVLPAVGAAEGDVGWTDQFGTVGSDSGWGVAVDATGVYVTGYTEAALPGQASAGALDVFVRKYDQAGTEVWTRQFGTGSDDFAQRVAVDATGLYVVGATEGTLPGQASQGDRDVFVRKYDQAGTEVWTRQFGTIHLEYPTGVAVDATGIYVTGNTWGALSGQNPSGFPDVFVRKYDQAGAEVWTRQFGTTDSDFGWGVAADATGVYLTGSTAGALPEQTFAGGHDAFVRKYDQAGAEVWTRQFGTADSEIGYGVAVAATGVYVTGLTSAALPGQTPAGGNDVFVRMYDQAGAEVWTRQFGSGSNDCGHGVAVNATGLYVTGYAEAALPGQVFAGGRDVFVRHYDPAGTEAWTRQFGTSEWEEGRGVAVRGPGVFVVGDTGGTLPGQTPAGGTDAFVRSYQVEPALVQVTFRSVGAQDGWVLEREAGSGKGGTLQATAVTLRLGDDARNRQYRGILSFDTQSLPDEAVVVGAMLRIRGHGQVGDNPFDTMALLKIDIKTGWFHDNGDLERFDFQAIGTRGNVGRFARMPADGWYRAPLRAPALPLVNLTGSTQVRLRFDPATDGNDRADYLLASSGDARAAYQPQLVVTYYLP